MQNDTKKRQRGRPRAFDETQARQSILDCFWEKGFAGSSLDELSQATGMGRPSLYGAFGNKERLYLEAIKQYKQLLGQALQEMMKCPDCRGGLVNFYDRALDVYLSGESGPRGCFIVCTATVEAADSPVIGETLRQTLEELDAALTGFFGRFTTVEVAQTRARMAACILQSLAIRSRAGQSEEALRTLARDAVDLLAVAPLWPG